ncbi:hypothetical protein E8D34_02325 [Nocardioides sp. GY 10113]|uniref:hypothetical protein n=1 Tax=Nocardioides sp. GY 10113 TaxID=2569761 RepID=UPI0010A7B19F|nr:hypothetical protein [Nocardioides sp. GY 10113]TIC88544.1 hypothetical protein E8D34_02325 [Nocardioides sp. GY 10113]
MNDDVRRPDRESGDLGHPVVRGGRHPVSSVVVLGDGPAGTVAAAAAALNGDRATLLGLGRIPDPGTLETLDLRAASALAGLGWYDPVVERAVPCGPEGWVVDRAWLDPLLRDLAAAAGVRIRTLADRVRTRQDDEATEAVVGVLAAGRHTPGPRRDLGPDRTVLTVSLPPAALPGLRGRRVEVAAGPCWSAIGDGVTCSVSLTLTGALASRGPDALRAVWRRALGSAPSWLPDEAADQVPRVDQVRAQIRLSDGGPRAAGDAALCVDPLSGRGLTLALEGGVRCLDDGYDRWLVEQSAEYVAAARAAYDAVGLDPAALTVRARA